MKEPINNGSLGLLVQCVGDVWFKVRTTPVGLDWPRQYSDVVSLLITNAKVVRYNHTHTHTTQPV